MRTIVLTDEQYEGILDAIQECLDNRDGAEAYAETEDEAKTLRVESAFLAALLETVR